MKFIHCSDIHLGRRPVGGKGGYSDKRFEDYFTAFEAVVDYAVKNLIGLILITGDLFDRKELGPDILGKTEKILDKLKDRNIGIILVEGNHDNITRGSEADSWIIYLEKKGYIKRPFCFFENESYVFEPVIIDNHYFYGAGYPGAFADETLIALKDKLDKNNKNIILVHTAVKTDNTLAGMTGQDTIDLFKNLAVYMAGGHLHSYSFYPKKEPYFFIPGSLEYWDLAEKADVKGFIVFDTEKRRHEFIPSNPRNKIDLTLDIQSRDINGFKEEFIKAVDKLNIKKDEDIVSVKINTAYQFYIDMVWCENIIAEKGAVKVIIKIRYPDDAGSGTADKSLMTIEDIEKNIMKGWEFIKTESIEDALTVFQRLKNAQAAQDAGGFDENFNKMIELILDKEAGNAD